MIKSDFTNATVKFLIFKIFNFCGKFKDECTEIYKIFKLRHLL